MNGGARAAVGGEEVGVRGRQPDDSSLCSPCLREKIRPDSAFAIRSPVCYSAPMSTLAEIEQAAKVLPSDEKEGLVASLLAGLRKEGISKVTGDKAARASLLPLAATAWSQDWDTAEEDEAWRDL